MTKSPMGSPFHKPMSKVCGYEISSNTAECELRRRGGNHLLVGCVVKCPNAVRPTHRPGRPGGPRYGRQECLRYIDWGLAAWFAPPRLGRSIVLPMLFSFNRLDSFLWDGERTCHLENIRASSNLMACPNPHSRPLRMTFRESAPTNSNHFVRRSGFFGICSHIDGGS